MSFRKFILFCSGVFSFAYSAGAFAGFLDMPEITETPELRGKTMVRDLDIPGVRDRNPDPKSGPRLAVKEFRIQGLVEYPELGITRETINSMVESIRKDLMGEGKLLPSGYTIKELGEISDLLVEIEDETLKRHVTPLEVQRLIWLVRDQRTKRGIHLGQIEAIADRITRFYRERGFILAKAYIPKQEVRDGVVSLTLLLGMLGEVDAKGASMYDNEDIQDVFEDMLAKPVTSDRVEERLYLVNDFPGLTVDGYFEPGYQVGDSKLSVNVKNESRLNANLRVDNHGTDETGLYRTYADLNLNNPFNLADKLHLGILNANKPSNTSYWKMMYEVNLFSPRWKMQISSSTNQYVVDQSLADTDVLLKINGIVLQDSLAIRYLARRSRLNNYSVEYGYDVMESDIDIGTGSQKFLDEKIEKHQLVFNFDSLNEKSRMLHVGSLKYSRGELVYGTFSRRDVNFDVTNLEYTLMMFAKVPFTDVNSRLLIRTSGQYSNDTNLSSLVRSQLGGPNRARAYTPSLFSADDSFYMGVDWVFPGPGFMDITLFDSVNLKETIKPFLFADIAWGKQNIVDTNSDSRPIETTVTNWGFGFKLGSGKSFSGNLMYAIPYEADSTDRTVLPDQFDNRLVFDMQYSF